MIHTLQDLCKPDRMSLLFSKSVSKQDSFGWTVYLAVLPSLYTCDNIKPFWELELSNEWLDTFLFEVIFWGHILGRATVTLSPAGESAQFGRAQCAATFQMNKWKRNKQLS